MNTWHYVGIGLLAVGGLIALGFLSPFPSNTTCVGLMVLGQCLGYYNTVSNGNNLVLGIVFLAAGAGFFILGSRKEAES